MEKIVVTEWFARIPGFRVVNPVELGFTSGIVRTVLPFELEWGPLRTHE